MSDGPAGAIYDRGYRHYNGPREGRTRRVRAIALAGVRRALGLKRPWRTKLVPFGLIVLAYGPVLVFLGVRILAGNASDHFLGFGYDSYLGVIELVLLLFAATAGPELLCPDRRQHVLTLVFTRPVTRGEYLAAKVAALLAVMGLVALVPLLTLFAGNTLTDPHAATYLREHLGDLGRIVVAGGALTVFYTGLALAVASLAERRGVATAALLGGVLATRTVIAVIASVSGATARRWLAVVDVPALPGALVDWVFGRHTPDTLAQRSGAAGSTLALAFAVATVAAFALVAWRIWRVQP